MLEAQTKIPDLTTGKSARHRTLYGIAFLSFTALFVGHLFFLGPHTKQPALNHPSELSKSLEKFIHRDIAVKQKNIKRFAYLSNSHGTTGGYVAQHIRSLLDILSPKTHQIFVMAAPGMYAPELLMRTIASRKYQIDTYIYATSYAMFADRMPLRKQHKRTRHFFQDGVPSGASFGFWMRNYDLPLFLDDAVGTVFPAFKMRHKIRKTWERPLARSLKRSIGSKQRIRFLEVDYRRTWQFPDGFAPNFLNWRLIEGLRSNQLSDLSDAIAEASSQRAKVALFNMPIAFQHSDTPNDQEDVDNFIASIASKASDAAVVKNYQVAFPSSFTTYDPLHPNLHGARLHAFDIVTNLNKAGLLDQIYDENVIFEAYKQMAWEEQKVLSKNLVKSGKSSWQWASLDFLTAPNTQRWLNNESLEYSKNYRQSREIYRLLNYIAYSRSSAVAARKASVTDYGLGLAYAKALRFETELHQQMSDQFIAALIKARSPIKLPNIQQGEYEAVSNIDAHRYNIARPCGPLSIVRSGNEKHPSGWIELRTLDGVLFALEKNQRNNRFVRFTDILGDHSFLLEERSDRKDLIYLPHKFKCAKDRTIFLRQYRIKP